MSLFPPIAEWRRLCWSLEGDFLDNLPVLEDGAVVLRGGTQSLLDTYDVVQRDWESGIYRATVHMGQPRAHPHFPSDRWHLKTHAFRNGAWVEEQVWEIDPHPWTRFSLLFTLDDPADELLFAARNMEQWPDWSKWSMADVVIRSIEVERVKTPVVHGAELEPEALVPLVDHHVEMDGILCGLDPETGLGGALGWRQDTGPVMLMPLTTVDPDTHIPGSAGVLVPDLDGPGYQFTRRPEQAWLSGHSWISYTGLSGHPYGGVDDGNPDYNREILWDRVELSATEAVVFTGSYRGLPGHHGELTLYWMGKRLMWHFRRWAGEGAADVISTNGWWGFRADRIMGVRCRSDVGRSMIWTSFPVDRPGTRDLESFWPHTDDLTVALFPAEGQRGATFLSPWPHGQQAQWITVDYCADRACRTPLFRGHQEIGAQIDSHPIHLAAGQTDLHRDQDDVNLIWGMPREASDDNLIEAPFEVKVRGWIDLHAGAAQA